MKFILTANKTFLKVMSTSLLFTSVVSLPFYCNKLALASVDKVDVATNTDLTAEKIQDALNLYQAWHEQVPKLEQAFSNIDNIVINAKKKNIFPREDLDVYTCGVFAKEENNEEEEEEENNSNIIEEEEEENNSNIEPLHEDNIEIEEEEDDNSDDGAPCADNKD